MSDKSKETKMTLGKALLAPFTFLLGKGNRMSLTALIITCVILLVAPYAYVWLCGLIFDLWLKLYDWVVFIFVSMIVFWVIDIIAAILLIIGFTKKPKGRK